MKRILRYSNFEELIQDVQVCARGSETIGSWSLGQIVHHIAASIEGSLDGLPTALPSIVRRTVGAWAIRRVLRTGKFPRGIPIPKKFRSLTPDKGADLDTGIARLRTAIDRFELQAVLLAEHPLGGVLSQSEWRRLHLLHAAHHMGFVLPRHDTPSPT